MDKFGQRSGWMFSMLLNTTEAGTPEEDSDENGPTTEDLPGCTAREETAIDASEIALR